MGPASSFPESFQRHGPVNQVVNLPPAHSVEIACRITCKASQRAGSRCLHSALDVATTGRTVWVGLMSIYNYYARCRSK